jgi:hypothetical protein
MKSPAIELTPNQENRTIEDPNVVKKRTLYRPTRSARTAGRSGQHWYANVGMGIRTTSPDPSDRTRRVASDQHVRTLLDPSFLNRIRPAEVQEEKVPKGEAEGREGGEEVDWVGGECAPVEEGFLRGGLFGYGGSRSKAQENGGQ